MSKTRLTEEQAAAVDLLATEGLVGNIDVHSAERRLHAALDPKGESPNPMHKDNRWAMLARTADLLDERTALVARAEQAERDRDTLARERNALRKLLDEAQPAWGIKASKESLDAVDAAYDATIASGALARSREST